jgi:hypothetical protein
MITTAYGPTPPQARLLAPLFLAFPRKRPVKSDQASRFVYDPYQGRERWNAVPL